MRVVPTNSFYTNTHDTLGCVFGKGTEDVAAFEAAFARYVGARRAFLVGSGTSALFIILSALKKLSGKTEVILPAYTVPTLTLAIRRAGLTTRLSDISPKTFNLDTGRLADLVTDRTLAVVPVHMFGLPMDLAPIRDAARRRGFFVVEDAAQAPGAELAGTRVGAGGDVGFFSLCKGKIISTFRGGVITTNREDMAGLIEGEIVKIRVPGPIFDARLLLTLVLLSWAMRPAVYGPLLPLVGLFKSTSVHARFEPSRATPFAARLGLVQTREIGGQIEKRRENGVTLLSALSKMRGIRVPELVRGGVPSFNHLPILVENEEAIETVRKELLDHGIDTARMYERPVHHVYDLGYASSPDPFPEAAYLARRLVVLPTHPLVSGRDLDIMIETIRKAV
jgi:perosamine synthetase